MKQSFGCLFAIAFVVAANPAFAEDSEQSASQPCVEVQIGDDTTTHLNCVNSELERRVAREHDAPLPAAPVDARSQSNQVGTFNETVTKQMMGNAYGVSPKPQRPTQTFSNPIIPNVPH